MRKVFFFVFMALLPLCLQAQTPLEDDKGAVVGIKTNIPYWGTATPNLGVEFRLAKHWTLEAEVGLNPFTNKHDDGSWGKSLKHFRLHPEVRYWFCESFYGHFLGLHVPYLIYNVSDIKLLGTEDERHQGWGTGVGISYGYQWLLHKHWNLEASLGNRTSIRVRTAARRWRPSKSIISDRRKPPSVPFIYSKSVSS